MSGVSDPAKVELWRARFARQAESGMKTAEFCVAEGVTQGSYYAWRRKLGLSSPRKKPSAGRVFQRVELNALIPALAARLPGGILIEANGASESALRAIVRELVRSCREGEAL